MNLNEPQAMRRVNIADLDEDYTEGGVLQLMLSGKLYTGLAYEMSPQGTLWSEQSYEEGILGGTSRDWYLSGQMRSETSYKWNRIHGIDREWFENGQLKSESLFELGVPLYKQEWNENGISVSDYNIANDTKAQEKLESQREMFDKWGIRYEPVR